MTHNKIVNSLVRQLRSRFPPNPQNKVVHISILLIFSSYFFIVSVSSSVQRSEMDIDQWSDHNSLHLISGPDPVPTFKCVFSLRILSYTSEIFITNMSIHPAPSTSLYLSNCVRPTLFIISQGADKSKLGPLFLVNTRKNREFLYRFAQIYQGQINFSAKRELHFFRYL